MKIIGYMDSPFVRRVGVSARFLELPYEHEELSIFRSYDDFRQINPLVKVPTVICDDGQVLVESTLIIEYMEHLADKSLMPVDDSHRTSALSVIGTALVAGEKVAQLIYETKLRPKELQHAPWIDRLEQQLMSATELMEDAVGDGSSWLFADQVSQADISAAIMWRFTQHVVPERVPASSCPGLVTFSARAEQLAQFTACPLS